MHTFHNRFATVLFAFLCVVLATQAGAQNATQNAKLNDFFDEFAAEWVAQDPDFATSARYFSGSRQQALERQTTPQTRRWRAERVRLAQHGIRRLADFDREPMSATQRISADVMRWQLEAVVSREPFADYYFPLDQFSGANVFLIDNLSVRHPLAVAQDADNYLARLEQIDKRMDEAVDEARRLARKNMIPPRFILEATIKQMRDFASLPPEQSPLVTALTQRMPHEALGEANEAAVLSRAARIVEREVYPAWRRAISLLESLLPKATNDAGLWRFKGGDAAYANALRRYTSTNMTADEIHEIGLREVARIEAQMDEILRSLGRTEGSVRERIDQLEIDLRYPDPEKRKPRARRSCATSNRSWKTG